MKKTLLIFFLFFTTQLYSYDHNSLFSISTYFNTGATVSFLSSSLDASKNTDYAAQVGYHIQAGFTMGMFKYLYLSAGIGNISIQEEKKLLNNWIYDLAIGIKIPIAYMSLGGGVQMPFQISHTANSYSSRCNPFLEANFFIPVYKEVLDILLKSRFYFTPNTRYQGALDFSIGVQYQIL